MIGVSRWINNAIRQTLEIRFHGLCGRDLRFTYV